MRHRLLALAILAGVVGGMAFAHGNKVHVKGTIEKISADSLQVKTADGKTVEVKLRASTVYLLHTNQALQSNEKGTVRPGDQDKPAKVSDLAAGYLVVIHATPKGTVLEADEVKFSPPAKPKS